MTDKMLNVRLTAGGKRGVLAKWHHAKPAIRFKSGNEYAVTEQAYRTQKHLFEIIEEEPEAPATPATGSQKLVENTSDAPPVDSEVPEGTDTPTDTSDETEGTEEATDGTTADAMVDVKAKPASKKYGKR